MDMMLEQFKTIFDRPEKVKKLRETILDLAVRGKLLEQDPNDEPASVLLERIKKEKERLIKEKKIKKEYCDDSISQNEIPYCIPNGWEWARLIDLGTYKKGPFGSAITKSMFIPKAKDTIKVYEQKNAIQKNIELGNYYISEEYFKQKLSGFEVFPGDILVSCAGTIGETYIVPENAERGIINQALMKMQIFNGINIDYFLIYFDYILKKSAIEKSNGSAMKNIPPFAIFKKMLVAMPPLEEQKRIVEKVNSLMVFCDRLEKALDKKVHYGELAAKSVFNAVGNVSTAEELEETLRFILLNFKDLSLGDNAVKELKNCILQLAVQGKLVPQDPNDEPAEVLLEKIKEEKEILIKEKKIKKEKPLAEISDNPYIIPSRWSLVRLGTLAKGIEYGTSTKADLDQSKVPVLRMNNIIDGKIDYKNLKYVDSDIKDLPRLYLNNKDLLFNRTNSYELVGKTAVFKGLDNSMTFASYLIRIELFNEMVNADYINIVMNSNLYRISQIEPEITQQNGQANFNGTKLKSTIIPLPPIEEQKRIVEKVNSLMILCDELEKKIQKQKDYSNRLMESILKSSF